MMDGDRGRLGSGLGTCGPASHNTRDLGLGHTAVCTGSYLLSTIYPCVANYLGNMFCVDIFFPLIMTHIEFEVPTDSFHRTYLCCVLCWETTQAGEAAKCWLCCSGREEEERCSMKILHIHRLASVTSAAPDTAAAGHMTYLTHAQVPSGFSCTDDYLPSSPAHWVQHCSTAGWWEVCRCVVQCADCALHYVQHWQQLCWDNFRHKSCNYINTPPPGHSTRITRVRKHAPRKH